MAVNWAGCHWSLRQIRVFVTELVFWCTCGNINSLKTREDVTYVTSLHRRNKNILWKPCVRLCNLHFCFFICVYIFFFICFWQTNGSFLIIFSFVAPHRGQPAAKCHPRWQPTRRLAVSCGQGRRRIRTRDCRKTVRCTGTEPPCLPIWATMPAYILDSVWKQNNFLSNRGRGTV